jgi:hypothetical protein
MVFRDFCHVQDWPGLEKLFRRTTVIVVRLS